MPPRSDPPRDLAFGIANSILARIRVFSRAFQIKPLETNWNPWQIQYLTDDLQQLEAEEGKVRGIRSGSGEIGFATLTSDTIQMVVSGSQNQEPYSWDQLLLDAYEQLPDVGGAIVMAAAALETFIG